MRTLDEEQIDFAMNVAPYRIGYHHSWLGATLSRTLVFFYGAMFVMVVLALSTLIE